MRTNEKIRTYPIPNNFVDESRILNGMLRTRFVVEAIISFVCVFLLCWIFIPSTVGVKLGITLSCSMPLALVAIVGINDDSLFAFVGALVSWRRNKQIMLYNDEAQTYKARPIDVMMSEVNPRDVMLNAYAEWKTNRLEGDTNVELIENVDFVFKEDTEYEKMMPKEMRRSRVEEKKQSKNKKEKNILSLPETVSSGEIDGNAVGADISIEVQELETEAAPLYIEEMSADIQVEDTPEIFSIEDVEAAKVNDNLQVRRRRRKRRKRTSNTNNNSEVKQNAQENEES